jgi:hypothetical protein
MTREAANAEVAAVREAALEIVRRIGKAKTTSGKTPVKLTTAEANGLLIAHTTPFTPRPLPSDDEKRALAAAGRMPLPYALDIWDGKAKVLSLAWSDSQLRVTTFKRGPWIDRLKVASVP